tara:strand:+ start:2902 stop:3096 length:195 start_codon:yes stop_codon:yes gene_type:complete
LENSAANWRNKFFFLADVSIDESLDLEAGSSRSYVVQLFYIFARTQNDYRLHELSSLIKQHSIK